jgi:chromosomal replication initiator protein
MSIRIASIINLVSQQTDIPASAILGPSREADIARARCLAMGLARSHTDYSTPRIGREFNRDHSSVSHALRRYHERRKSDEDFDRKADFLGECCAQLTKQRRLSRLPTFHRHGSFEATQ